MLRFPLFLLAVLAVPLSAAEKLPKPDRISAPPTAEHAALIQEGVALHDQQNYEGAIAKYKQVLVENPWQVNALHELAFTYFANKNYQASLETARLGAQCRSQLLARFYISIANALDELGKGAEAIDTYKAAIKQNPGIGLLHYNLAISLRRAGKQADAKSAVEKALQCDPNHSSSHALLGSIYQEMGYRIPAILAYSRLIGLQPESARSAQALKTLSDLLTQGVGKGKQQNEINIFVSLTDKNHKDEGDFTSVEMMMSIGLAADLIEKPELVKKASSSPFEKVAEIYTSMGEALETSKPKGGFAASYYAPHFAALNKAGHTEAFTAYAWKAANLGGAAEWMGANEPKIEAFLAWSNAYAWPTK